MKILIAGAGKVGRSAAGMLSSDGHDITLIDKDSAVISDVSNALDVICFEGSATSPEALTEAGVAEADLFMAATELDEVNMISGIAASKLGAKHVVARIRNPEYLSQTAFLTSAFGLDEVINPEYECAKEIARILRFPGALGVDAFSKGELELVEVRITDGSLLNGLVLRDFHSRFSAGVLVCAVNRGGKVTIPNGDFTLLAGDRAHVIGSVAQLRKFFPAARLSSRPVKTVMIMGGGRIAAYLAQMLRDDGISVTVIEKDRARCDELCALAPYAQIICGDGTQSTVLHDEGLDATDAFVSLTGDDDYNIITSMYARHCGVGKVITKVNRSHFRDMLDAAGLDCIVTPRELVAQQITRYARSLSGAMDSSIESLYRLADAQAEALEFAVSEGSACTGKPLKELKLRQGILISALIRGGDCLIPNGGTVILPGDHVVLISAAGRVKDLDSVINR